MIDPLVEELILPMVATGLYPRGPDGKKVHVSKVYRDMKKGHRGIFLESVSTPRLATSREAVARYFSRLGDSCHSPSQKLAPMARRREEDLVERQLDSLGF